MLVALFLLLCGGVMALAWRLVRPGVDALDRVLLAAAAADIITVLMATAAVHLGSDLYFEAALAAALVSFVATVAAARYLTEES